LRYSHTVPDGKLFFSEIDHDDLYLAAVFHTHIR
jgi:hypothetical protein